MGAIPTNGRSKGPPTLEEDQSLLTRLRRNTVSLSDCRLPVSRGSRGCRPIRGLRSLVLNLAGLQHRLAPLIVTLLGLPGALGRGLSSCRVALLDSILALLNSSVRGCLRRALALLSRAGRGYLPTGSLSSLLGSAGTPLSLGGSLAPGRLLRRRASPLGRLSLLGSRRASRRLRISGRLGAGTSLLLPLLRLARRLLPGGRALLFQRLTLRLLSSRILLGLHDLRTSDRRQGRNARHAISSSDCHCFIHLNPFDVYLAAPSVKSAWDGRARGTNARPSPIPRPLSGAAGEGLHALLRQSSPYSAPHPEAAALCRAHRDAQPPGRLLRRKGDAEAVSVRLLFQLL